MTESPQTPLERIADALEIMVGPVMYWKKEFFRLGTNYRELADENEKLKTQLRRRRAKRKKPESK